MDSGSRTDMISEQLARDWEITLLPSNINIIFQNQELCNNTTQELCVTIKLPNEKGDIVEKTQNLRSSFSKNIPYGCLLGIHTLFNFKIGFKIVNDRYKPYFNEEEISSVNSLLSIEDLNSNKISFGTIERFEPLNLNFQKNTTSI